MSHNITDTDNLFSVHQPTWHGLGTILPTYPTREQAQQLAHPWEPITEPVYLQEPTVQDDSLTGEHELGTDYIEATGHKAVRRSDNGNLLGIVNDTYQAVTNNEMWDIAEALQNDNQEVRYETAGTLKNGQKTWILIRLNDPITVQGDPNGATIPYYALQNAHDGSGSLRGQAVMTRIVCNNTAQAADIDARVRGTEFTFRHTRNITDRIEHARQALTSWRHSIQEWKQLSEHLAAQTLNGTHQDFLDQFMPEPPANIITDRVRENIQRERDTWTTIHNSITSEGIRNTPYGLIQTTIEYAEHYKTAHTQETRFNRTYLTRNTLIQSASKIAKELTH